MKFYSYKIILFFLTTLASNAIAQSINLAELREAVKDMCVHPDRKSSYLVVEGDAEAKLPVKLVNLGVSGKVTYGEYTGIVQALDNYTTDPRQCSIEVIKLLIPAMTVKEENHPILNLELTEPDRFGRQSLEVINSGKRLVNLQFDGVSHSHVSVNKGCSDTSTGANLYHKASSFGWNENNSGNPITFYVSSAREHQNNLISQISEKYDTKKSCIRIGTTSYFKLNYDDDAGRKYERYYHFYVNSKSEMNSTSIWTGGKDDYIENKELIKKLDKLGEITSLNIYAVHNAYHSFGWNE